MTPSMPTPWTEILSQRFRNVHDEYGPHSQSVASAFMALDKTRWLEHAGEPWLERVGEPSTDDGVVVVRSWDEALTIFGEDPRYNVNGVLQAACSRVDPIFEQIPEREVWWQKAREEAKRYTLLTGWAPRFLAQEHRDLLFEHLWEYVSMLIAEIIASPEADCTYFREQLPWFHEGHFPCGWDGNWPRGRMRVF